MSAIQQVMAASATVWKFTMVAASDGAFNAFDGYRDIDAGTDYGSLTGNTTPEGNKILIITNDLTSDPDRLRFNVRFTSFNPGATYYHSLIINSTTFLFANNDGYQYINIGDGGGNAAFWEFVTGAPVFTVGQTYNIRLIKR